MMMRCGVSAAMLEIDPHVLTGARQRLASYRRDRTGRSRPRRLSSASGAPRRAAMFMTTMGSACWPQTAEARLLCVLLALYSFTMFGYVTATLSSFFIDRDASRGDAAVASQRSIDALSEQIAALTAMIQEQTVRRPQQ
jgi:hypothetical protein